MNHIKKTILSIAIVLGFAAFSINASAAPCGDQCSTRCNVVKTESCSNGVCKTDCKTVCKTDRCEKGGCIDQPASYSTARCNTGCSDTRCASGSCSDAEVENLIISFIRTLFSF
jgi:hypothetical protein